MECLTEILREASSAYIALYRVYDGRASFPINWEAWRSGVTKSSLLLESRLFDKVLDIDRELYILNQAVKNRPDVGGELVWLEICAPSRRARFELVNSARDSLGAEGAISLLGGRPSGGDEVWTSEYWKERYDALYAKTSVDGYVPPYT
jgi:hypothetical protein